MEKDNGNLSDSVHELENFYDPQLPTWEKLGKAHARFQLNRAWLGKDPTAAAALKRIKETLDAAAPYVKKRRIVQAARLAPSGFLETQADVNGYLERLRRELEAAICAGERIEIR